jgi:peptidyl-prolyl cis-trans isomerase D
VTYAVVPDKLAEKITPTDQDIRAYYDQHKTDYRYLEPQKKIRYLFISQEKVGEKLPIPDSELQDRYNKLDVHAKEAGVKVQQILLRVPRKDMDAQIEQKAKDLVTKARGNAGVSSEATFSDLAKGSSEDQATAKNGGFLPTYKKNPNKVDGLYDRTVDMQPGDITDPIRYGGHWYILRRVSPYPRLLKRLHELTVSTRNQRPMRHSSRSPKRRERIAQTESRRRRWPSNSLPKRNMNAAQYGSRNSVYQTGDDVQNIGETRISRSHCESEQPERRGGPIGTRTALPSVFVEEKIRAFRNLMK